MECEGKSIILVHVPRASRQERPVYIGPSLFTGTFRRNFEGDYPCDEQTVRRMLAEAVDDIRDAGLLPRYNLDDLDVDSLAAYRNEFKSTLPRHPWVTLDDKELLRNLGAWARSRETGGEGLTVAGLLMFGKQRSILDAFHNYVVDYQEHQHGIPEMRWTDRITTDGTWSGNLYDFYRRVYSKLTADLKVPFRLEDGHKRKDETDVHEALREAFVNTLIHSDFTANVSILVIKKPDRFIFRNPGSLRLPLDVILQGGISDCRNRNLQKMFQLVGAAEQAGSGIPKILRAWKEQHWRTPILRDETKPEQSTLTLPMVSFIPQETIDVLVERFGAKFRSLTEPERLALTTAAIEGRVNNERLRELSSMHPTDATSLLQDLVVRSFLMQQGTRRGTYYVLFGENSHQSGENSHQSGENSHQSGENSQDIVPLVKDIHWVSKKTMEQAILELCTDSFLTAKQLSVLLGRSQHTLSNHHLNKMIREGKLELRYPNIKNHPNQAYRSGSAD